MSFSAFVFCMVIVVGSLAFSVGAVVVGKVKLKRATRPIEYYPPRGFSPVDFLIAYRGFRIKPHCLVNPLILYWADKGFIAIEEDCKRGLKLTKLKELEREQSPTEMTMTAAKNFRTEKALFDDIFGYGDVFYTLAARNEYADALDKFMNECAKNAKTTRTPLSKKLSIATFITALAVALAVTVTVGVSVGGPQFLMMIFPLVAVVAYWGIPNEGIEGVLKVPFFAVWGGVPLGVLLSMCDAASAVALGSAIASAFLTVSVLSSRIDIRTKADIELYGRICAFKTFLLEVEAERLEMLIDDDPDYYYNILPYCYLLGITEKLKPKFDRITMDGVAWYLGDLRDSLMF